MSVAVVLLLAEVLLLVARAPRRRVVLASRVGVALSSVHALAAFLLGAIIFGVGWYPFGSAGDRLVAIHLTIALLGWLMLLILTVGRTLGPMLALAAAVPARKFPLDELALIAGLWLIVAGLAAGTALAAAGAVLILVALVRFGFLLDHVRRGQRLRGLEGPIAHFLAGIVFLAQAVLAGGWLLAEHHSTRLRELCVLFLLGGWAVGVTLGHLGKLLSLSAWTSWPRGPRPSQAALYPRRAWLLEAVLFVLAIELTADGILARSPNTTSTGCALLITSALTAAAAAAATARISRPSAQQTLPPRSPHQLGASPAPESDSRIAKDADRGAKR